MKIIDPFDIEIGHWVFLCCHEDLFRIEDEGTLIDVIYNVTEEDEGLRYKAYETKREALMDIREEFASALSRWNANQDALAEIDALLAGA